jgi:hypothetical protein
MDSLGLTWIPLNSLGLPWTYLDSIGLTWAQLASPGFTWTQLESFGVTWSHLESRGVTWIHLDLGTQEHIHAFRHSLRGVAELAPSCEIELPLYLGSCVRSGSIFDNVTTFCLLARSRTRKENHKRQQPYIYMYIFRRLGGVRPCWLRACCVSDLHGDCDGAKQR